MKNEKIKADREREKVNKQRIKNKETEAKIEARKKKGGTGMQVVFFEEDLPAGYYAIAKPKRTLLRRRK